MVFVGWGQIKLLSTEVLIAMGIAAGKAMRIMKRIEVWSNTSPGFTKLLNYMKSNDPEQLVPSTSGIRIVNSHLRWPVLGDNFLFIRSFYPKTFEELHLYSTMKRDRFCAGGVIVLGTPGIGKSCSIGYFLWRFVRVGRTVVVYEGKHQLVSTFTTRRVQSKRCSPGDLLSKVEELNDPTTIFMWDPPEKREELAHMQAFVIYFVSPQEERYKSLKKTGVARMVYFPVYTREEMLDIVPHARSTKSSECQVIGEAWVDKVLERFDGNLRVLFGNDQYFGDRCSEQDKKINALAQNKVWRPVEELPKMSSTIVKLCPPNKVGARFVYKYLSKYVQVMVSFQMELTKLHQIKSFIDVNQAVNWFETLCHNVVQRGDKFTMKKLPATKSHRTFDIGLERFGQTQSYRDFEELKKSRKSDKSVYWYPVNPNCAAVDSIGRNAGEFELSAYIYITHPHPSCT